MISSHPLFSILVTICSTLSDNRETHKFPAIGIPVSSAKLYAILLSLKKLIVIKSGYAFGQERPNL